MILQCLQAFLLMLWCHKTQLHSFILCVNAHEHCFITESGCTCKFKAGWHKKLVYLGVFSQCLPNLATDGNWFSAVGKPHCITTIPVFWLFQCRNYFLFFRWQLSGLVVECRPAALLCPVAGVQTHDGEPKIFNIVFHQQKLSSLSIACDIKLEGALYSVFYSEASERPWTSLNEYCMCQTPSLIISLLRLPLAAAHINWLYLFQVSNIETIQYNIVLWCFPTHNSIFSTISSQPKLYLSLNHKTKTFGCQKIPWLNHFHGVFAIYFAWMTHNVNCGLHFVRTGW